MESFAVLGVFLLGACAGSLITMILYRSALARVRELLKRIQKETERKGRKAV